jgi:DNA-binding response OmpR family regulator
MIERAAMPSPDHTVLIIDDEPNLRRSLALILERSGYQVFAAGCADEARDYLQRLDVDLVFLDLKMPDISGLDLLPEIHQYDHELPVLILTGHATLDSAIEAVRKGAKDYLLKPLDPELILTRISQIISEQRQPRRRKEIVSGIRSLLSELGSLEGLREDSLSPIVDNGGDSERYLNRGTLQMDFHTRQVTLAGRYIPLSPTAFDYLTTLVRHSPDVVTCEALVEESQGYKSSISEAKDIARWRIHELRKALEVDPRRPRLVITVRGIGYRLIL